MIFRIIPLLLITLVLPDWYIYARFVKPYTPKRLWRVVYWLPTIAMLLCTFALGLHETHSPTHAMLVGWFMFAYFAIALPKIIFCLISLIGWPLKWLNSRLGKAFNVLALLAAMFLFGCVIFGFTQGARRLQVNEITFASKDLPAAFDGYRIAQFSDIHLGTFHGHGDIVPEIVRLINAQKADMIVFTGDLVNYQASELFEFEPSLRQLQAPDGVFSIMGNHDYCMYIKDLTPRQRAADIDLLQQHERGLGWDLLLNENRIIHRGTDSIALVGVENDGRPPFPSRGNLKKALAGIGGFEADTTRALFKVLLSHDPTHWRRKVLPQTDIQLMLAGHTHAMQFEVDGWSPAAWFYREWQGLYHEGARALNVNIGVGGVMMPFRLGAWPTIDVITLRNSAN